MSKDTTKKGDIQEKNLFSFSDVLPDKKIQVDFSAPDLSSNGGLVLVGLMKESIARKVARLIPDHRNQLFVQHSYEEMVCQRVGQIMCGYEDANDCDRLRHDSALKMSVGRKASDPDLCSQPTMTRLENHLDKKTLWAIAELFVKDYMSSFDKAPRKIILDVDDTNANTYGAQQLSLFNDYYDEYSKSWTYKQRVIAKIEVSDKGVNIRFIVTSNRNNKPETVYRRYCKRGTMELWIKDLKYFRADRMSCSSFKANMFRLFLYGAAYVTAYRLKSKAFSNTEVEVFTMDSFMKRIMLSAVFITEKKTFVRFSFSPHHRHLEAISQALTSLSA